MFYLPNNSGRTSMRSHFAFHVFTQRVPLMPCTGRGWLNCSIAQLLNCSIAQLLNCSIAQLLKPPNSGSGEENNINMCAKLKKKKLLRVFHFEHFAVVNSSAEKYCMHVEFWALWIKILTDCIKRNLHVRYAFTVRCINTVASCTCTHVTLHVQLTQFNATSSLM